ncbi:MAG TPA: TetR/AcrR family transcriptional regulator [Candidatus Sulfotelmatobacter sp.]|nr:TetR/AcrR family transcriptional regulator [Candidatus Sulfotelmatobacter sp.]
MAKPMVLPAQQERSRESFRKLLKATAEVLGQHGVEGATIPRIARHAGLTPGSVYRRFHNKEALLETAILGILERQDERLRTGMTPLVTGPIPLPVFAEHLITSMVVSYRANAGLLRGMKQFVQGRMDTAFAKKAAKLEIHFFQRIVDLFLSHRGEIQHPQPRIAVSLGLMMVVATLYELVVWPSDLKEWKGLLPKDDQALKEELTRAFLRYLGIEKDSAQRAAKMNSGHATHASN